MVVINAGPILQVVVDKSRNILYTLTEKGTIHVHDLGANGQECKSIETMTADRLVEIASLCNR